MYHTPDDLRHDDGAAVRDCVRDVLRFGLGVGAVAVLFLAAAAVWVGTRGGSTFDAVACGAPQRTLLALGAPIILFLGGVRAFVRTYQLWRQRGVWWPWQGAGWFLMAAMLLVLVKSAPAIAAL